MKMLTNLKSILTDHAVVHVYVALAMQSLIALPLAFLGYPIAYVYMAVFVFGFYVGRERRQAESGAGSRLIAPWNFSGNPDGPRQFLVPGLAAGLVAAGVMLWASY